MGRTTFNRNRDHSGNLVSLKMVKLIPLERQPYRHPHPSPLPKGEGAGQSLSDRSNASTVWSSRPRRTAKRVLRERMGLRQMRDRDCCGDSHRDVWKPRFCATRSLPRVANSIDA